MAQVERRITQSLEAIGNASGADLRHLNLPSITGEDEVSAPTGMLVPRGSNGPDAFVLGWPAVVEVKRSSARSKVRGPHVVHVERIWRQGLRPGDPDGAMWFDWLRERVADLPKELRGWHDATTRCWDDESAACFGWYHSLARGGWTCVACPQPAPYLFCNYGPAGVEVGPETRLFVLGGVGDRVQDFYGGADGEYGRNLNRFTLTTHIKYVNRLVTGMTGLRLLDDDRSLVSQLVTLMWMDMTCEEAAQLDHAVDALISPLALRASFCDCELCARWPWHLAL